ncbi:hypothetical protein [Domibacillus tundrae]|uniref:hypothetical protein n=1 Tax=Domibacillus tundrae TaxID=1587527 RepID=UPI000618168D|nr:hypothetical protein [Domibacillus tundrae]
MGRKKGSRDTNTINPAGTTENQLKDKELVNHFKRHIGRKAFILTEAFPFMFIGKIKKVLDDMAVLSVETTSVPALENREWSVHIHSIEAFYIEKVGSPKIPDLNGGGGEEPL